MHIWWVNLLQGPEGDNEARQRGTEGGHSVESLEHVGDQDRPGSI